MTSTPSGLTPSMTPADYAHSGLDSGFDPIVFIRRWVWKMAIATLALMAVGSATRVMNAGLACPDWPLCYGQLVPTAQMNLRVFLEWFHRLDAALIGLMAIGLVGLSWFLRSHLPTWLPWASLGSLFLIISQGILGGLTVTQLLRFDIVTAHLATAMLFLLSLLVIGIRLLPISNFSVKSSANNIATNNASNSANKTQVKHVQSRRNHRTNHYLRELGLTAAGLTYGQSLLGGLVGSRWAAHQCLDLAQLCQVMNSHLLGVVPATVAILALVYRVWRTPTLQAPLRQLAYGALALLCLQISLGVATLRLHLQVEPLTVAHHTIGVALVGVLVCFTVLAFRENSPSSPGPFSLGEKGIKRP
jgi:heme a synthase